VRPRIRTVKPEFFTDQDLYLAEKESGLPIRLSFEGLWCCSDREGRFPWKPMELKVHILPYDPVDFSAVLDALASHGFVVRYTVAGSDYGWIPTFAQHQHINQRESPSELPAPGDTTGARTCTHVPANVPEKLRRAIIARDGRCLQCGSTDNLTVDHIVPKAAGGTNDPSNLRTLCGSCNSARPVDGSDVVTVPHVHAPASASAARVEGNGKGTGKEPDPPVVPPGGGTALVKRRGRHLEEVKTHLAEVFAPVEGQTAARIDREQLRRAGAEFVFAYWAKKLHHPSALFDEKRETRIRRALQENHDNLSELCYVVDGVLLDPWEGRRQQDDILVIMRDRTHIEKLAGLCPGYRAGKPHLVVAHLGAEESHAEEVPAEVTGVGA